MESTLLETPLCSLTFEHKVSYLHAHASGKRDSNNTCKQIWKQILTESKLYHQNKILFERNIEGIGTVAEFRKMISDLSDFFDGQYIAYVDMISDHYQTNRLGELIASSFNLNFKFCSSVGEAKEWLILQ